MMFLQENLAAAYAVSGFIAGVGLMYLVMRRTYERRQSADQ